MTLLEMTFSGGVMILAIAALRALTLRRLPKAAFTTLWWAAALRLLIPVELPSRLSVYTLLESLRPKAAPVPAPAPAVPSPRPAPVLIIPSQTAAVPAPAPKPFPLWTVLWAVGAAALALWFLVRYIRWRRRFRESLPADCPGLEDCLRARRRVRLRVTDQIAAPLTYGLLRPVILLPRTLDLGDREAAACVLAHEMAHIRRLDSLLKLVLTAALCLHWFNPAVWLLYVLANRDMELCCDEAAVLSLGEDSRERYALALLRLAELRNECVPLCGFSHKSGMEERIRAIMSIQKKSLLACFAALALVLGITTAFATSARPAEADEPLGYDMIDRELHAQSSAESAAQWKEVLAPYEPFGLKWTFDDPDLDGNGLTMTWEGREVRGIYDQEKALWITEHTGNGAYGPDAVELYAVYEGKALTGLRLATEEEQVRFDQDRKLSADALKVENLVESVRYDSGNIYFTIPESEEPWSIFIQGRILLEDGSGMSVHYLQEESEQAEWVPRMTYSFEVGDAAFDELTMDIRYGDASYSYPLTLLLPEGKPLAAEPLPGGKADIPEGAEMIWPVDGGTISQAQGTRANPGGEGERTHNGVDIAVEKGTPVYAAGKGTVKEAGFNAQDGNFVRIDHGNGQETFYAHCDSLQVEAGDAVELGQTIATVGSTGLSTGPHLHFEVLLNGVRQDIQGIYRGADLSGGSAGKEKGAGSASALDPARCYEEGSLPLFQIAFSRLSQDEQGKWLDKIYADRDIAFFGAAVSLQDKDSALIRRLAETSYKKDDIAFFSNLTARMSKGTLEGWLDKAQEDENWAFQSVLFDALGRGDEFDEQEKSREGEWEEARKAEYRAAGIEVDGKNYYYQGELAGIFLDIRANQSFYTLEMNPAGTVNVKVVRGEDGKITEVAYMTDAEIEDLLG